MTSAELSQPRLPAGSLVITPGMSFSLEKSGFDLARFGAYHASQDTRFRDFSTGGFPNSSRPESDYLPRYDRAKVIARARVMFRNNPYLAALLLAYVQEIGTPTLKSQTSDPDYNDAKERAFERWAQDCEAEEDLSLDEVIEIFGFEECIAGELFIIKRREGWLQLIASELCGSVSTRKTAIDAGTKFADGTLIPAGATERDGIVRDSDNLIIGYRFGQRDDNGAISFAPEKSSIVQKQYVFHLASRQRTEQSRGIPLLAPVLNALQDLFETAHARAQQVKNASCLSLWITKNIDPYGFAETMRGSLRAGDVNNVVDLKTIAEKRSAHQGIKAGAVYYGEAGEQLQVIEPKLNADDFHAHYIDLAQVCAACLNGMPIEIGLEGFRSSSYSSARGTVNKWKRNVLRSRKQREKFLDPLQLWQSRRFQIFGDLGAPPASPGSVTYNTDENVFWGWPAIPDIDGLKTAQQNIAEYNAGMTTLEEIYANKGQHADVQIPLFVREKAKLAKAMRQAALDAGLSSSSADQIAAGYLANAEASVVTATSTIDDEPPAGKSKSGGDTED